MCARCSYFITVKWHEELEMTSEIYGYRLLTNTPEAHFCSKLSCDSQEPEIAENNKKRWGIIWFLTDSLTHIVCETESVYKSGE